jgi:ATP-binding cassette subfamily F protein uup
VRDAVSLASMAMQRLGKDVVDLLDVSVAYGEKQILSHVEWRIAPGERTGVLGVNGAGKSTLLSLVAGSLQPTSGRVKRGKTVKIAVLTQQLAELDDIQNDRVSEVIGRQRTTYVTGGKEVTPSQLLERLGFTSAQLSTPVKDLSGGQKRRLQLLLILLDEPNVLILDEPTNDLDTDMLAAMEDLLDSFPGTLLVVSHDRYLLERVTDQQYAVIDRGFRHLPGGVEQYLQLRAQQVRSGSASGGTSAGATAPSAATAGGLTLGGAERRAAEKELSSYTRRLEKLDVQIRALHADLARHDQGDYEGLGTLTAQLRELEAAVDEAETNWIELSERLES